MPRIETRTRIYVSKKGVPVVVLDILLLPRGSGNRAMAKALAAKARASTLGPHLLKVVTGASRVTLHMRSSLEFVRVIAEWPGREGDTDVPGQLLLPGLTG
jgi:hypothetical protein